jgi:hypothetical protein
VQVVAEQVDELHPAIEHPVGFKVDPINPVHESAVAKGLTQAVVATDRLFEFVGGFSFNLT